MGYNFKAIPSYLHALYSSLAEKFLHFHINLDIPHIANVQEKKSEG